MSLGKIIGLLLKIIMRHWRDGLVVMDTDILIPRKNLGEVACYGTGFGQQCCELLPYFLLNAKNRWT